MLPSTTFVIYDSWIIYGNNIQIKSNMVAVLIGMKKNVSIIKMIFYYISAKNYQSTVSLRTSKSNECF